MKSLLANPETATFLQELKPHLGQQGAALTDGILAVMNFANSSLGRDVLRNLAQLSSTVNQKGKAFTLQMADVPANISSNLPFVMFLVFALLTFSENPLASGLNCRQKR